MKIELFSFWNDRLYCQWWIVIFQITFYGRNEDKTYCLLNIENNCDRWIFEFVFIRWDILFKKG